MISYFLSLAEEKPPCCCLLPNEKKKRIDQSEMKSFSDKINPTQKLNLKFVYGRVENIVGNVYKSCLSKDHSKWGLCGKD